MAFFFAGFAGLTGFTGAVTAGDSSATVSTGAVCILTGALAWLPSSSMLAGMCPLWVLLRDWAITCWLGYESAGKLSLICWSFTA